MSILRRRRRPEPEARLEAVPTDRSNPPMPAEGERTAYQPGDRGAAERPVGVAQRRRSLWRPREAGAAAARTVGLGVVGLGRLVLTIAVLIALLIGLAIVLRLV